VIVLWILIAKNRNELKVQIPIKIQILKSNFKLHLILNKL
jgi:hypothetical protein